MNYEDKIADCETLKKEIEIYRPLDPSALKQLRQYYRVGLTYTSTALEGNTLTETETKVLLEDGITVGGKPVSDHLATIGHAKAVDKLYDLLKAPSVSEQDILTLHQLVTQGNDEASPGQYRNKPVIISGTTYTPPQPAELAELMNDFIKNQLPQWLSEKHPIHVAALAHLKLVALHPFLDGNGRTARLIMNLLLLKSNYPITIIPPILRQDYINSLNIAHTQGNPVPFLNFISNTVLESAKDLLRLLKHLHPTT